MAMKLTRQFAEMTAVRTFDQVDEGSLQPRKIALEEVVLSVLSYQLDDKVDKAGRVSNYIYT